MTGIQQLDLPSIWASGTQIASANQRNRLFEYQLAQMQGKQKALSTLQGGLDPTTGINWDTGRPGLGGDQQLNLLTQAFPEEMGKAQIASLIPDPDKRYKTTEHGYFDLRASGGPKWVPNNSGTWAPWNAGAAPPAAAPPAAAPPGSRLFSVTPGGKGVDLDATDRATVAWETGGSENPATAQNPDSSAFGPRQFTKSTWIDMLRRHAPGVIEATLGPNADLTAPGNQSRLHALRGDEDLTRQMGGEYAKENAAILSSAGIEVNPRNLVVSHFLGGEGGKRFLSADPNTPGIQAASPEAVQANRNVFYDKQTGKPRTVGEILSYVDQRIAPALQGQAAGGTAVAAASGAAAPPAPHTGPYTEEELTPAIDPMTNKVSPDFGLGPDGQLHRWPSRQPTTNITLNNDKVAGAALANDRADRVKTIRDQGNTAERLLPKLDQLEHQLAAISNTGPGAQQLYQIAGMASTIGRAAGLSRETIDSFTKQVAGVDSKDQEAAATIDKLVNEFVSVSLRSAFSGLGGSGSSNLNTDMIMRTVPGISTPAQASQYIIRNIMRPALEQQRDLWNQVRPTLRTDKDLAGLDDIEHDFYTKWEANHPSDRARGPTDNQQPAPTPTPPPTPPDYDPGAPDRRPPGYPDARWSESHKGWFAPDPARPGKYLQIFITPAQ